MAEYTSTIEGFQRAMEWSLTGPSAGVKMYAEATALPTFYHVMNGRKSDVENFVKGIEEWRGKVSADQFLRDGENLAAHMTGTVKVDGVGMEFESFMFGKVDRESRKLEWLREGSVWGPRGEAPERGVR
ncbi:hypothetical protein BOTCAL_0019g00240 [Botryotinia calthae]|uniref:SnoaL-like domain-containing protein n=1 Tax=Botryotinia calthae TaxID=38488 RepID=A0A4Y8DH86_9HELO|nr:hypothetical protein BOTCAL_0019g00240 [Botryotinia calthae]